MDKNATVKSKCFVYLRRSQDREDRQQLTLDKQDNKVREIIEENEFVPVHLPSEERSAKLPGRPIFGDMMAKIYAGEVRYIAVWAVSRLSRNPIDTGNIIHAMDMGFLLAVFTPKRTYRNTPDDKKLLANDMADAKKNNDDLSVQVLESFEQKRELGEYPGPAPIGYINAIISPGKRNIVPHPDNSLKIVDLITSAASGCFTLQEICFEAEKIGLRSKNGLPLSKQTVVGILKNRVYTGVFKYGSPDWVKGSYKSLISLELYNQVQVAMGWTRKRHSSANTRGQFYAFKGILMCGSCQFNITAYTKPKILADGSTKYYEFYTCTKKNKKTKCLERQVPAKKLDNSIKKVFSEFEISKSDGEQCMALIEGLYASHLESQQRHSKVWEKDRQEALNALEVLDRKLETGVISDESYKARTKHHNLTLDRTNQLIGSSVQDAERWLELSRELFSSVINLGSVFEEATPTEKRELMKHLGSNWTLSNKKVELTPRRPLDLLRYTTHDTVWRARPDSNRRSPP